MNGTKLDDPRPHHPERNQRMTQMDERESIVAWLNTRADFLRSMSRSKEYGLAKRAAWDAEAKMLTNLATQIRRRHDMKETTHG